MKITTFVILIIMSSVLPLSAQYHIAWVTAEPDTIYDDNNTTFSEIEVCIHDENNDPVDDLRVDFDSNLGSVLYYDYTNFMGIAETVFWEGSDGPGVATVFISVDDTILGQIEITILELVSAGEEIPLLTAVKNYPNPFEVTGDRNTGTTISFSLNPNLKVLQSGEAEISIFNIRGQRLRSFAVNISPHQIDYTVFWDGKGEHEKPSEPGVYFYLIEIDDITFKGKMTLLR